VTKEAVAAGRAIAPDLRMTWLVALRADLRRAVRNISNIVGIRRDCLTWRKLQIL